MAFQLYCRLLCGVQPHIIEVRGKGRIPIQGKTFCWSKEKGCSGVSMHRGDLGMRWDSVTFTFPSVLKIYDPKIYPSQFNIEMSCIFHSKEGELFNRYRREEKNMISIILCQSH